MDQIAAMRKRVERYRRASDSIWDPDTVAVLRSMADELQAEIAELERARRAHKPL